MLNETNFTNEVSKAICESSKSTSIELLSYTPQIISIIAIMVTGIIAYHSITATSRNLFVQMNRDEITKNIKILREKVETGNRKDIFDFIDSVNGIYIPEPLHKKIRKLLKKESSNDLNTECISNITELMNKYITYGYC